MNLVSKLFHWEFDPERSLPTIHGNLGCSLRPEPEPDSELEPAELLVPE